MNTTIEIGYHTYWDEWIGDPSIYVIIEVGYPHYQYHIDKRASYVKVKEIHSRECYPENIHAPVKRYTIPKRNFYVRTSCADVKEPLIEHGIPENHITFFEEKIKARAPSLREEVDRMVEKDAMMLQIETEAHFVDYNEHLNSYKGKDREEARDLMNSLDNQIPITKYLK